MRKLCTILAALTLVVLCFILMPAEAEAAEITASGTCGAEGDNLTWTLDSEGTLTISGIGEMEDYYDSVAPWYSLRDSIFNVEIDNGVSNISNDAFFSCDSIISVTIGENVAGIGNRAFCFCYSLKNISIPDSVTEIGWSAFYCCSSLESIHIGVGVGSIGNGAFGDCWELSGLWVSEENACYSSDSNGVLFDKNKSVLLRAPNLLSGNYIIPDSVISIGDEAFSRCENLLEITIPASVKSIGVRSFSTCASLNSVTVPNGVLSIGDEAFMNCHSLTEITIPSSVTELGYRIFYSCFNLSGIWVDADNACFSSDSYGVCFNKDKTVLLIAPEKLSDSYTIPATVTEIAQEAFYNCTNLKGVIMPNSVTHIGLCAFSGCYQLTDISVSNSLISIDDGAFWGCSFTDIVIPDSVTSMGDSVFSDCRNLSTVVIGKGVTHIANGTFAWCDKLTVVVIPNSVKSIGDAAFWNFANDMCVVYCGTEEEWEKIEIGQNNNDRLLNAQRSYHAIENDVCTYCGMSMAVVPTDSNLVFTGNPGLSFQDYIGMQVMFKNSLASGYDKFYVEITQVTPDGVVTTISTGSPVPGYSSYTLFEQKIVSWSMTEEVTMTLYAEKDGIAYKGASFTGSVKDMAMNKLPDYAEKGDTARCQIFVDMLNYGAAVQLAFDYNTDDLANADLGEYAKYGTTTTPEMSDVNDITGSGSVKIYRDNISLQDRVEFQFMVKTAALAEMTVKATVGDETADVAYTESGSYTIIRVAVEPAHMRNTYTIGIYDADGNAAAPVYNVSAEAYAKEKLSGDKADVFIAMMRYGDSVALIA